MKIIRYILLSFLLFSCQSRKGILPSGFSYVQKEIPNIELEMRYFGSHNFTGRPVIGYEAAVSILSTDATSALKKVQQELNSKGLGLKIFDTYRPQRAVTSFETWALDINDTIAKREFIQKWINAIYLN